MNENNTIPFSNDNDDWNKENLRKASEDKIRDTLFHADLIADRSTRFLAVYKVKFITNVTENVFYIESDSFLKVFWRLWKCRKNIKKKKTDYDSTLEIHVKGYNNERR